MSQITISACRSKQKFFTIAEIITKAYDQTLTFSNIKDAFEAKWIYFLKADSVIRKCGPRVSSQRKYES